MPTPPATRIDHMITLRKFYHECIEVKIVECNLVGMERSGRSLCARYRTELKRSEAAYYEDQRERLVAEMLDSSLGMDLTRINSFLTRSFFNSFSCECLVENPTERKEASCVGYHNNGKVKREDTAD